jgi:Ycf66 protein N-terminus
VQRCLQSRFCSATPRVLLSSRCQGSAARMLAASRGGIGTRVDAHLVQVQVGLMEGPGQMLTWHVPLLHDLDIWLCLSQICRHGRHLQPTAAAAAADIAYCLQQPWRRRQLTALMSRQRRRSHNRSSRTAAPRAMVNVDFSPALILGLGMVAGGVLLYNVRINRPWISRDYDVVISSISVLVGGILIFQVGSAMGVLSEAS